MDINDVVSLVEKNGTNGTLLIIFLFIIITIVKSDIFTKILSKASDKIIEVFLKTKKEIAKEENKIRSITDSDISNHDIFSYIDFWFYSKVPTLRFSTEYRSIIFRKYLKIYLKSHKEVILVFIKSKDYQNMDQAKLSTAFIGIINDIVNKYEKEATEIGIPRVVIEKMKIRNNDTISLTLDLIEGICSSQFYESDKNLLKVYSILNILLSILESTISNSELVCNSINGQLKGLTFRENGIDYTEPS
jgi:hypothetical protein